MIPMKVSEYIYNSHIASGVKKTVISPRPMNKVRCRGFYHARVVCSARRHATGAGGTVRLLIQPRGYEVLTQLRPARPASSLRGPYST